MYVQASSAFAARICDKYQIVMSWLKFDFEKGKRIIDGLGLIRLFLWFSHRCFWAASVVHVVSVQ